MERKFVIVCYDIPDTKKRNRMVHFLHTTGLSRIQYSVFSGVIPISRLSRMEQIIRQDFSGKETRVLILPICRTCIPQITSTNMAFLTEARSYFVV